MINEASFKNADLWVFLAGSRKWPDQKKKKNLNTWIEIYQRNISESNQNTSRRCFHLPPKKKESCRSHVNLPLCTTDTRFYWSRTVISHNRTFISESNQHGHLFSFTTAAQAVLFKAVVMGSCKFSPTSPLKRKAYLPALMMSPLLSSHPSWQWQDKGSLPGEPFWKAQPFFLDSVPIMMDTQRTTSHKASQWPGTRCFYVGARVSLLLIASWSTMWSCQMKK